MQATIRFETGNFITAELNGDSLITATKPDFPNPLGDVEVLSEDVDRLYENAQLVECASVDGRYWFTFHAESQYEKTIRELREENEMLEGAIAELAEIIGGNE